MHADTRVTASPAPKPTPADRTLGELLRAIAADGEAGAWGEWSLRLLADEQATVTPSTECAKGLRGGVA